ncbi:hypothetical protein BJV82DRAFT_622821 [Fennellomyces sp. T-0311]|nr:hypothetical protein BJV82DRAFT_622821 [Fennellomyces sp. T-0311]
MILFQGFYDADECFELLSKKTMFIGGDPRDTRNWVPHPTFSEKFWFLSHQLVDHHSGECALIPEIIDAILANQRQKEEEIKRIQKEKEEREREEEEEVSSSVRTTSARSSAARRAPLSSVRSERSSNIRSLPLDL